MNKVIEQFGSMRLAVVPPQCFKVMAKSVMPVKGKKDVMDVSCQIWYIILN